MTHVQAFLVWMQEYHLQISLKEVMCSDLGLLIALWYLQCSEITFTC